MSDHYHIDLTRYSLLDFEQSLGSREMIPSRVSLKDNLDERFKVLAAHGITNLKELIDVLKTKPKIELFAATTGLTVAYLTLLGREARSYLPSPIRLDKFPGVPAVYVEQLDVAGIRNSKQMINRGKDRPDRENLAQSTGIPLEGLDELVALSDLARAYGVGPVFARLIYDVGIKSIKEFIECTAEEIIHIYEQATGKKADFGVADIQFSLELARQLAIVVEP